MIVKRIEFRLAALAGIWVMLSAGLSMASTRHPALAQKAYLHAVALQEKLEARPAKLRTAAEYNSVIREYRNTYFYDFANPKAAVAAKTMGDLYEEMGRQFREADYFQSAIKSYQYVMSQYPGSTMACEAGVAIGKVYLDGLNDPKQAEDAYRSFLEKYPKSEQSTEARKQLKEIADLQAAQKERESARAAEGPGRNTAGSAGNSDNNENSAASEHQPAGKLVEVTEIHDWVGPDYTRVVIGAEGPFQYNTLRLSHPDRIVFDLPNTHLSHDLMKKSVPIHGAFLRDIRVGQFKPDVTRIVLDVNSINNYSAFPLPNPFRLIIDVHGSSTETARNAPERGKAAPPSIAEHPRSVQPEQKSPAMRQEAPLKSRPEVAEARHIEKVPQPKSSPAIEFQDQDAAKAAAETASGHKTIEAAKQNTETPPAPRTHETAKPGTEVATAHQPYLPENQEKAVAAASKLPEATKVKSETASVRKPPKVTKRITEIASNEMEDEKPKISTKPASPIEDGSQTLTRALGLKVARIVIDPGHGGFDTGTIGPTGLEEKNVVLDIGLRLRKLFETRTDSQVFMTRSTDTFIPLEERTAIANEDHADLFISIHANASHDQHVRGIETYFLNFTSDPEALQLAARENATSQESVNQLQSLIKKIALNNKIEESQELARDIQTVLYRRMARASHGVHNRGVRKAPFVVLIGANMPSILTEISFLSNPHSEHLLREPAYREDIAKALFNGIEDYITNLGSVRVAQRTR